MFNLACDLGSGLPIWGIDHFKPSRPQRTVILTQEDTEDDIQDRVQIMVGGGREMSPNVQLTPKNLQISFDSDEGVAAIARELDTATKVMGGVDLVVFDPMRRFHRQSENDSDVIQRVWVLIDRIQQNYDCSVAMVHHLVKPSRDPRVFFDDTDPSAARGSGDLFGGADAWINVARPRDTENGRLLQLYFQTKRGRTPMPAQLHVDFATGKVRYDGYARKESRAEAALLPSIA